MEGRMGWTVAEEKRSEPAAILVQARVDWFDIVQEIQKTEFTHTGLLEKSGCVEANLTRKVS